MTKKPAKKGKTASKGGRPAWRPSIEDRQTVEQMKFCGESENVIARALGVAVETLRKHCPDELADGHANRRKELTSLLFTSARAGNVSAQKHLDALGRAAGADETVKSRAARPAKLGKKEEQQAAAEAVATASKFAPPAPPKLVVDNR